jgi:DNA-directed RNA polymerase subunit RPC12/RpoP
MAKANSGNRRKTGIEDDIARAVGAGKTTAVETVDFADPARPRTCLEVDFPILPVNQVATIEGNAGKPIYQMSKWWARRRSTVFRSILIGASAKAPADPAQAAKTVWDLFYANHQKKAAFAHLRVADIFMGGGTTLVEGSRLGMKMWGTDLNPIAWLVVKNEFSKVTPDEVKALLAEVDGEVRPAIAPYYACDCPRGHKGSWTHVPTGKKMGSGFDPLSVSLVERQSYRYEGPEIIYVFWAKHGPCQVTGCGHRTPIMSTPVVAVKTLSVKAWEKQRCEKCRKHFDVEDAEARMAPGIPLVIADSERAFAVLDKRSGVRCPHCQHRQLMPLDLKKRKNKKVDLTLLLHPSFLLGSPAKSRNGALFGGSATDLPEATVAWNAERAKTTRLIEVRGKLPERVTCPETGVSFETNKGTVPKKSHFTCQGSTCGRVQDVLEAVRHLGKTGPVAAYAIQGYCPSCAQERKPYGGRFFKPAETAAFDAALHEWDARKDKDLSDFWPRSELPTGFMTTMNNGGLPNHGYTHWWTMFNPRQLLVHAQLLRAIAAAGGQNHRWETREFVLGAFQQYLRNQNMFAFWHMSHDHFAPMFTNSNFHPKSTVIEVGVFPPVGYGPWPSTTSALVESLEWCAAPWDLVSSDLLAAASPDLSTVLSGKSQKVVCGDRVTDAELACVSATELSGLESGTFDLVVTDPPFGGLLHYSELADFFYVWLRLVLKNHYPDLFAAEYTPKALEVVSNRARQPEDPEAFYQRLLTQCWREAHRILKPGGILAFTFHHSEDDPWVAVLESLFDAGFYLEATYPIRSDETKGEGAKPGTIGSQKIEYDIVHVCRKRIDEPKVVSWARMRREVQGDVRQLQALLEHHAKEGLAAADLQVIKRGKALEYFSRHYGKVLVDQDRALTVKEAVVGIIQLLDEETGKTEPPPVEAEPFTRQFLRIFNGRSEQARDQLQKYLRGTGVAPEEFEQRGWCKEEKKVYSVRSPLDFARAWIGKHRRNLASDYDQTMFLIGACFDGSGINASDTLKNENFKPHPALASLLDWHSRRAESTEVRNAAARARSIYDSWERSHQDQVKQLALFAVG